MKAKQLTNEQCGFLCEALSYLLGSGIGTADALTLLAQDSSGEDWEGLLTEMAQKCDAGCTLSQAITEAGCFPAYLRTLVHVGEQSGRLDSTLAALADFYSRRAALQRRLKQTLTYPAMLLGVLLCVIAVLLVWVMPIFADVYAQLGTRLQGFAGVLLAIGQGLGKVLPWLCGGLFLLFLALCIRPVRKAALARLQSKFSDRGPLGSINSARFLQALLLGISSGMTYAEAASLAQMLAGPDNPAFSLRCSRCVQLLEDGEDLRTALEAGSFLTRTQGRLLTAGVHSGHGEQALETITRDALLRSEESLEESLGKIEPAMVAVACVMIGAVLISVMLPLLQIMNVIG